MLFKIYYLIIVITNCMSIFAPSINVKKFQLSILSLNKPDTVGAIASGLCLMHCIFTPVLFALQGLSSGYGAELLTWWKT